MPGKAALDPHLGWIILPLLKADHFVLDVALWLDFQVAAIGTPVTVENGVRPLFPTPVRPWIWRHSVLNHDGVQTTPRPLPSPALSCARRVTLQVPCRVLRRERLSAARTAWRCCAPEAPPTPTWTHERLNLGRNRLVESKLRDLRDFCRPCAEQSCAPARIAVCVGGVVEPVVDQVVHEHVAALLTGSFSIASTHVRITRFGQNCLVSQTLRAAAAYFPDLGSRGRGAPRKPCRILASPVTGVKGLFRSGFSECRC